MRDRQRAPQPGPTSRTSRLVARARKPLAATVVSLLLVGAGWALVGGLTGASDDSPTFTKIVQDDLRYPEPIAAVSDLLPSDDAAPWVVVGSIIDPERASTHAAVWRSADGQDWERTDITPADEDSREQMQAVTRAGDTMLAVGSAGQGPDADAVVWTAEAASEEGSDDGEDGDAGEWVRLAPPEMGGDHEQWAFDVAAGEGGVVAIGGERAWGEVRPRVWFSRDGEEWEATDGGWDGPFAETGEESVTAVTAVGSGFVVVGWQKVDGEQDGLAWYSSDGETWERLDAAAMAGDSRQAVLSVTTTQDDQVIAGGYQADGSGQGQPVVWRSDDGRSWDQAAVSLGLYDDRMSTANDLVVRALSVRGDEVLAAGGARARPHLWRSDDAGASWSRLPNPVVSGQFVDGIDLVAAASDGSTTHALGAEPTVLQLSGERWVETTGDSFPDGGSKPVATSVLIDDDTTIVGGYLLDTPGQGDPKRYRGHIWRRDGGGRFSTVEPEELPQDFESGSIDALSIYPGGYVGVGVEDFAVARTRLISGDNSPNGMVWVSEDGEEWARQAATPPGVDIDEAAEILALLETGDPAALAESAISLAAEEPWVTQAPAGGRGTRALRGVAPLGEGFIAVGSAFRDNDIDPIVVVSEDGRTIEGETSGLAGEGTQRFHDVCVAGDRAVAVGVSRTGDHDEVAIRLRDADGEWHAGSDGDGSFSGRGSRQALACAASDEGLLAVGSDDSGSDLDAKAWVSEDGEEWEEVAADLLGGNGDQEATAVAPVPDGGWLIVGTDSGPPSNGGIALWRLLPNGELVRLDDGESELAGPGPKTVADVAITPRRTVIVGADIDGIGIWEAPTSALDP
jgi:hypothetical protein